MNKGLKETSQLNIGKIRSYTENSPKMSSMIQLQSQDIKIDSESPIKEQNQNQKNRIRTTFQSDEIYRNHLGGSKIFSQELRAGELNKVQLQLPFQKHQFTNKYDQIISQIDDGKKQLKEIKEIYQYENQIKFEADLFDKKMEFFAAQSPISKGMYKDDDIDKIYRLLDPIRQIKKRKIEREQVKRILEDKKNLKTEGDSVNEDLDKIVGEKLDEEEKGNEELKLMSKTNFNQQKKENTDQQLVGSLSPMKETQKNQDSTFYQKHQNFFNRMKEEYRINNIQKKARAQVQAQQQKFGSREIQSFQDWYQEMLQGKFEEQNNSGQQTPTFFKRQLQQFLKENSNLINENNPQNISENEIDYSQLTNQFLTQLDQSMINESLQVNQNGEQKNIQTSGSVESLNNQDSNLYQRKILHSGTRNQLQVHLQQIGLQNRSKRESQGMLGYQNNDVKRKKESSAFICIDFQAQDYDREVAIKKKSMFKIDDGGAIEEINERKKTKHQNSIGNKSSHFELRDLQATRIKTQETTDDHIKLEIHQEKKTQSKEKEKIKEKFTLKRSEWIDMQNKQRSSSVNQNRLPQIDYQQQRNNSMMIVKTEVTEEKDIDLIEGDLDQFMKQCQKFKQNINNLDKQYNQGLQKSEKIHQKFNQKFIDFDKQEALKQQDHDPTFQIYYDNMPNIKTEEMFFKKEQKLSVARQILF